MLFFHGFVFEKPLEEICEKFHVSCLNPDIMRMFEHTVKYFCVILVHYLEIYLLS